MRFAKRMLTALLASTFVAYAAYGAPLKSKGVPTGWTEDFEEAKALSAKEGRHILLCSVRSDRRWDQQLIRNVFSQGKFTGKAKKRFVLMMADFADDARNLSLVAMRQVPDIRRRYNLYGNGSACVVDCDGNMLQRLSEINGDANSCWDRVDNETLRLPPARTKTKEAPPQIAQGGTGGQRRQPTQTGTAHPTSVTGMRPPALRNSLYYVIDLSAGPDAALYPISSLDAVPPGGWTDEYKTTKLVLRRIEPGTFIMGDNQKDESRRVNITKPFYIGVFEVTQKQYELAVGSNPSIKKGDMRPVENVSWDTIRGDFSTYNWPGSSNVDPSSFVGRIQARTGLKLDLPTEAQWEYACRAGTKSKYNNGGDSENDLMLLGRFALNQTDRCRWESDAVFARHKPDGKGGHFRGPTVVGSYLPNSWGLYDMHGNVNELCLDVYKKSGSSDDAMNPMGDVRVWRSGNWRSTVFGCRSAHRAGCNHDGRSGTTGFRLCSVSAMKPPSYVSTPKSEIRQSQSTTASVPTVAPVGKFPSALYCVIDLSTGPSAASYPVSSLDAVPPGGWTDEYKTTKLVLRRIEPGTFIMGADQKDESRRINITQPFYMGVFELTQKQYELVTGNTPSKFKGDMRPVGNVSFNDIRGDAKVYNWPNVNTVDANSFMGRIRARTGLNLDLPPETEWEYACRAGTTSKFNNGGDGEEDWIKVGRVPPNQAELGYMEPKRYRYDHKPDGKGGYDSHCTTVGMYLPNAWGLYDMLGNNWELTLEWAPLGAKDGIEKVMRGGCWNSPLSDCTSASYRRHEPHAKHDKVGFRLFISTTGGSQGHIGRGGRRTTPAPSVPAAQIVAPPRRNASHEKLYCVIDLSAGASASTYPVSYMKAIPGNEWPDEYKTTKLVLRRVEPGSFTAGSSGRRMTVEKPFYIGVFEVTQGQWERVMGENPSKMSGRMRPVEGVSFDMARGSGADVGAASFIGRLRARTRLAFDLPDADRWEYACRAGTTSRFNNGCDSETEEMWQLGRFYLNQSLKLPVESKDAGEFHQRPDGRGGCRTGHTTVGSYLPNEWMLYDMHGNVAEMCRGAEAGMCILRGGSWADSACRSGVSFLTSSAWRKMSGDVRVNWLGLRLIVENME